MLPRPSERIGRGTTVPSPRVRTRRDRLGEQPLPPALAPEVPDGMAAWRAWPHGATSFVDRQENSRAGTLIPRNFPGDSCGLRSHQLDAGISAPDPQPVLFTVRRSEAFETAAEKGKRERRPTRRRVKHLPPKSFGGWQAPREEVRSEHTPHVVVRVASPPFGRRGIGRRSSRTVNKTGLEATARFLDPLPFPEARFQRQGLWPVSSDRPGPRVSGTGTEAGLGDDAGWGRAGQPRVSERFLTRPCAPC